MTRSRSSARAAGTRFETTVARYLADVLDDDRIERRARTGAHDRGDVAGVRTLGGGRVVIEAKDCARLDLAGWLRETETERGNDDALVGIVVHKRRGTADPARQYVTCALADLVALLTGARPTGGA
jgi:hypothetical protein